MCKYQYMTCGSKKYENMSDKLKIRGIFQYFLNAWKYKWWSMTLDLKFSS